MSENKEDTPYTSLPRVDRRKNPIKDIKRSQAAKLMWKRNRRQMIAAIKKYAKSPEGKQYYRHLARFNKNHRGVSENSEDITSDVLLELIEELY